MASGTEGYAAEAARLTLQYESLAFADVHRAVMPLLPSPPASVLDIGAGTGRDAAALAALGHTVLAVEPTAALREAGQRLHASPRLTWLDDALPDLPLLAARGERFDLVMLVAVLMHLDAAERARAMAPLAAAVAPGGLLYMTVRHGPVPPGRRMFEIGDDEIQALAAVHGLKLAQQSSHGDMLGRASVRWSALAFRRAAS
jgi:SAM-dependent methyltransferase